MAHKCVHCGRVCPPGSREILDGCNTCGSHFFYYIRDELLKKAEEEHIEFPQEEKKQIEKDIRDMAGIKDPDAPVVLDFESVKVTSPGKYEIDLINLFRKERPLVYKLEEGKYIIDLASNLEGSSHKKDDKV